ncbi:MAG: PAS domain S-box protein [Anaerolineae bacterium]|nr:PAS domain S-box protein [Anaerolineae bacterium]
MNVGPTSTTAITRLHAFCRTLFTPSPHIVEADERDRARLLLSLLVGLQGVALLVGVVVHLIVFSENKKYDPFVILALIALVVLTLLYGLARTRYFRWSARLLVTGTSISVFLMVISPGATPDASLLVYQVIPIILSSMLLAPRTTLALCVVQTAVALILVAAYEDISQQDTWISFLLTTSTLLVLADYHRRQVARIHSAQLAKSELRQQLLADLGSDFAYSTQIQPDSLIQLEWQTEALANITGYTIEEITTQGGWRTLVHPDDLAKAQLHVDHLLQNKEHDISLRIVCKNGAVRWLQIYSRSIWDETAGRFTHVLGTIRDITQQKQAEMELALEHRLLRAMIDHVPALIYFKDLEHRFRLTNETHAHILGVRSAEDLIGKTDRDFYPDHLAQKYMLDEQMVIESGCPVRNREEPCIDSNGNPLWLLTTKIPLFDKHGTLEGIVGIGVNITERKNDQEALIRYTKRLDIQHTLDQAVLAGAQVNAIATIGLNRLSDLVPYFCGHIIRFDPDNNTTHVLASAGDCKATPPCESQLPLNAIISFDTLNTSEQRFIADARTLDNPTQSEQALIDLGVVAFLSTPIMIGSHVLGELFLGAKDASIFNDEAHEIAWEIATHLAAAITHTELREQNEQHAHTLEQRVQERTAELARVTHRVETILNNSSDAIIMAYADGTITQVNQPFDELFQYNPDEAFHQPLFEIIHPDYHDEFAAMLYAVTTDGKTRQMETTVCRKDGSTFFAEVGLSSIPVLDSSQRASVVCSMHDITDRIQAELELRKMLEKEKDLNLLKSRFVSMASHEFRTPLTTIVSSAEILNRYIERMDDKKRAAHFAKIFASAHHMTDLLEDVLLVGHAESGRLQVIPEPLNLAEMAQTIIEEIKPSANDNVTINFSTDGPCDITVMDHKLMRNVITNLLSNAVKYSPEGGTVALTITCTPTTTTIRVSDEGIGIPKHDLERIFEPFHRAENVDTIQGTGLGLAIARHAISLHKGTITVDSEVDVGTTFTVTLPTVAAADNSPEESA